MSTSLSPWRALPAGRGGPGGVGTGRHPKSDGTEGADFRWRLELVVGSQSLLATSPRARCSRLSPSLVRGAASEPWPRLVHGGKGSWSGLGQFSAQGTWGARGAGRAAAGTGHPLTGCPGPVPRAGVKGRTDPNWPHTRRPQRRAARSLPHHAAGWGSAPRRPGTEASERPMRSPAPEAAGLGSVPGLPGQGSSGRREPLCHSVRDLGHVPCP